MHIKVAPKMNAISLNHLFPGRENSSTISSEHDTYMKLPPAILIKMTLTISDIPLNRIPMKVPIGVAAAKIKRN